MWVQGSVRRKKKVIIREHASDEKKIQSVLRKIGLAEIPSIDEVNQYTSWVFCWSAEWKLVLLHCLVSCTSLSTTAFSVCCAFHVVLYRLTQWNDYHWSQYMYITMMPVCHLLYRLVMQQVLTSNNWTHICLFTKEL